MRHGFVVGFFGTALALGLLADNARAQPGRDPRAVAGCYRLTLGTWSNPLDHSASMTPPVLFALDTLVAGHYGRETTWTVRPSSLTTRRHPFPAAWSYRGTDSLLVFWSTGFTGVRLQLAMAGDTLRGYAITFDDVDGPGTPPDSRASVVAVRSACTVR